MPQVNGDLLEKLNLTVPTEDGEVSKPNTGTPNPPKLLLKRAGVVLAFNLMNAVLAVAGVVAVTIVLAGAALNVCWLVIFLVVQVGKVPFLLLFLLPERLWRVMYLGAAAVVALYLALFVATWFISVYTAVAPYVLIVGGWIGLDLCLLGFVFFRALVWSDVRLVRFVDDAVPCYSAPAIALSPDKCAERVFSDGFTDSFSEPIPLILPVIGMSRRMWAKILYFGFFKVIAGGLSIAAVFCCVVQPTFSICTVGDAGLFFSSMSFHTDPIAYVVVVIAIFISGGVGLILVAGLSVKSTRYAFGERSEEEEQSPTRNCNDSYEELESANCGSVSTTATSL